MFISTEICECFLLILYNIFYLNITWIRLKLLISTSWFQGRIHVILTNCGGFCKLQEPRKQLKAQPYSRFSWFSKGNGCRRPLTSSYLSPPWANDTASQPGGICPALHHQPRSVINPAAMTGCLQWPHTTSGTTGNIPSLWKDSASALFLYRRVD